MKRRVLFVALLALGLQGFATGAQAIGGGSAMSGGYWGCVGTRHVDVGVCFENPLPERLPIPETPSVPEAPAV